MQYIYHAVPEDMQGDILYPLNALKNIYPEIYTKHKQKYKNREDRMEVQIPFINCLWNDVLHFTPIHPKVFLDELRKYKTPKAKRFFQIDIEDLDSKNLILFSGGVPEKENFYKFDIQLLEKMSNIVPTKTFEYYKDMYSQDKRPLVYAWAPHVLHKGSMDVSDIKTIEV